MVLIQVVYLSVLTPPPPAAVPLHGPAGPISLKTVHRTVFRALDAPFRGGVWGTDGALQPPLKVTLSTLNTVLTESGRTASKRLPLWGSWLAKGQTDEVPLTLCFARLTQ